MQNMNAVQIAAEFVNANRHTFDKITAFMLDYNRHTNLTRITSHDEIIEKHYIDSILPLILLCNEGEGVWGKATLQRVPRGTLLDIGSGAGFPGIPMKLFCEDLSVTLLDSSRKRTDYLKLLLSEIEIDCKVVTGRSEALAHEQSYRGKYDVVTARAVSNFAALCEYCLPFVKVGGVFLALKGKNAPAEVETAANALGLLGGEVCDVVEYALPCGDERAVVVVKKVAETNKAYPRVRVNIAKNPL
jgi:16S rRNA (guanine527-N7)-methyltransferase